MTPPRRFRVNVFAYWAGPPLTIQTFSSLHVFATSAQNAATQICELTLAGVHFPPSGRRLGHVLDYLVASKGGERLFRHVGDASPLLSFVSMDDDIKGRGAFGTAAEARTCPELRALLSVGVEL